MGKPRIIVNNVYQYHMGMGKDMLTTFVYKLNIIWVSIGCGQWHVHYLGLLTAYLCRRKLCQATLYCPSMSKECLERPFLAIHASRWPTSSAETLGSSGDKIRSAAHSQKLEFSQWKKVFKMIESSFFLLPFTPSKQIFSPIRIKFSSLNCIITLSPFFH